MPFVHDRVCVILFCILRASVNFDGRDLIRLIQISYDEISIVCSSFDGDATKGPNLLEKFNSSNLQPLTSSRMCIGVLCSVYQFAAGLSFDSRGEFLFLRTRHSFGPIEK